MLKQIVVILVVYLTNGISLHLGDRNCISVCHHISELSKAEYRITVYGAAQLITQMTRLYTKGRMTRYEER